MNKGIHKNVPSSELCVAQCCRSLYLIWKRPLAIDPLTSTAQSVHYASMKFLDTDHKTDCLCKHVLSVGWVARGGSNRSVGMVALLEIVKYSDFKLSGNISTLIRNITNTVYKYLYSIFYNIYSACDFPQIVILPVFHNFYNQQISTEPVLGHVIKNISHIFLRDICHT